MRRFLRVLADSLSAAFPLATAFLRPGLLGTLGSFLTAALIFLLWAARFLRYQLNSDRADAN